MNHHDKYVAVAVVIGVLLLAGIIYAGEKSAEAKHARVMQCYKEMSEKNYTVGELAALCGVIK